MLDMKENGKIFHHFLALHNVINKQMKLISDTLCIFLKFPRNMKTIYKINLFIVPYLLISSYC